MERYTQIDDLFTRARQILAERFGHDRFLPGQEESLRSILSRRNLLVVMPTGSGKSLLYQLPALIDDGLTLVVSPLISLMKDQVDELKRKGIPATFVNSSLGAEEQRERLNACADGAFKLLYIAPERFRNAGFLNMLGRVKVSRLAVDEAHCISEWGHDFRPDYLMLSNFMEQMKRPLLTALTATATKRVQQDIVESLGFAPGDVDVHVHGFDRPNLALSLVETVGDNDKDEFLLELIKREKGSGIVYIGTRKSAENLGTTLREVEPTTVVYHAGLEADERAAAQDAFIGGKARVVVATMAFGMGIDKSDVRFVAHYNYPGSVEQYYQEIGRAGRDGLPSHCVLLHSYADRFLREFFIDLNYPGPDMVSSVYEALWKIEANPVMLTYKQIAELCDVKIKDGQVGAAVRMLDTAGLTRSLSGDPTYFVTFDKPGSEILSQVRGPAQSRVLEALSSTADLEKPGRYEFAIARTCHDSGLAEDQVRRALTTMDHAGVITYEPPFRGRGIEKLVEEPLPFDKVPIDWKRNELRRRAEEEKLKVMEEYFECGGCRREFILHYFGEDQPFSCGVCDNCAETTGVANGGAEAAIKHPDVALPVLLCVRNLRFPLGKIKVAQVVCGSREKDILNWKLDKNPTYGLVRAEQDYVKNAIDDLIRDGYLKREGEHHREVLALTDLGMRAAEKTSLADLRAGKPKKTACSDVRLAALKCVHDLNTGVGAMKVASILTGSQAEWVAPLGADKLDVYGCVDDSRLSVRDTIVAMINEGLLLKGGSDMYPVLSLTEAGLRELEKADGRQFTDVSKKNQPASSLSGVQDSLSIMILELLTAEPERAKQMLPELRMYHPRVITERIIKNFDSATESRVRARSVWALGELGYQYGLAFLISCAGSDEANIRRLAASALGKVAVTIGGESEKIANDMENARQALLRLAEDSAPQVREYAKKSLDKFYGKNSK